jgi:hypothetical protein
MTLSDLQKAGVNKTPAYNAIKNYKNTINTSYIPKKGDVFFLVNDPNNTYIAKHVGIVESVTKQNGYTIITSIEGNINGVSGGSQPYYETSQVNRVRYIRYGGYYYKLISWTYNFRGNVSPKMQKNRQILGFYPTNLYN